MKVRRPIRALAWTLLAFFTGFLLSIGAGWSITRAHGARPNTAVRIAIRDASGIGHLWKESSRGFARYDWTVHSDDLLAPRTLIALRVAASASGHPLPRWLGWPDSINPPAGRYATLAAGWPMLCLRSGAMLSDNAPSARVWGAGFQRPTPPSAASGMPPSSVLFPLFDPRLDSWLSSLPVSIIAGGMLLNTLFWSIPSAIVGWIFLKAGKAVIRVVSAYLHRRRAGCPRCGYPLEGLTDPVCPECGLYLDPSRAAGRRGTRPPASNRHPESDRRFAARAPRCFDMS